MLEGCGKVFLGIIALIIIGAFIIANIIDLIANIIDLIH
jgi:hypothetical protein